MICAAGRGDKPSNTYVKAIHECSAGFKFYLTDLNRSAAVSGGPFHGTVSARKFPETSRDGMAHNVLKRRPVKPTRGFQIATEGTILSRIRYATRSKYSMIEIQRRAIDRSAESVGGYFCAAYRLEITGSRFSNP
jgi:hypothetical protein